MMEIKSRKAVGTGVGTVLLGIGIIDLGVSRLFNWARAVLETLSGAQTLKSLGEWVLPLALILGGLASIAWGLGAFSQLTRRSVGPRRIPINRLRQRAAELGWDFGPKSLQILDLGDAIRQSALDGTIVVWGRDDADLADVYQPLVMIDKEYWIENYVDATGLLSDDNFDSKTTTFKRDKYTNYVDLHLSEFSHDKWIKMDAEEFRGRTK